MANTRKELISKINSHFRRGKHLIWIGLRGADAEPLFSLEQFSHSYSLIAPIRSTKIAEESLENISHERVDLNRYSTEFDSTEALSRFCKSLATICGHPSIVVPYRPMELITAICYSRRNTVQYLGLFHGLQAAFDYKPWVELELKQIGINMIPWQYLTREDVDQIDVRNHKNAFVLRTAKSSGGAGLSIIRNRDDLKNALELHRARLYATAPFLIPNIPLNINACVFPSGDITIHGPSLQLVGIASCTGKELGYCGNDFARVRDLKASTLEQFEKTTLLVGRWLHAKGYLGAFGIDALIYQDRIYVTEVNPRFQGSSNLASQLDIQMGHVDLFLAHMAAFLGIDAPKLIHCTDLAVNQEPAAQVYGFNLNDSSVFFRPQGTMSGEALSLPAADVLVAPEGMLFRMVIPGPITDNGDNLTKSIDQKIRETSSRHFMPAQNEARP